MLTGTISALNSCTCWLTCKGFNRALYESISLFVHIDWKIFLTETVTHSGLSLLRHSNELLWEIGMNKQG